jgi:hypothetical protein
MKHTSLSLPTLVAAALLSLRAAPLRAEASKQREALRTDEAETTEPMTKKPLKAAMQNLFLQEDAFPQKHFQVQVGARVMASGLNDDAALSAGAAAELGLVDSWTLSLRVPDGIAPSDERGLGNSEVGVLYSFWVGEHEDFRLTANLRNVFPSPSRAGENAFAHDLSVIAYARWAPLHVQAVATLDVSYGRDMRDGPRARPEGAAAAIVKVDDFACVLEAAALREFHDLRYVGALGFFAYPGSFELGVAATLDITEQPITVGAIAIVSYAIDPPE